MPYVLPPSTPAASRLDWMAEVLIFVWAVVARTPAWASVDTTGLSTISTSGGLPCCAASSTLLVSAVVSEAVRAIVTPALVPHVSSSLTQAEPLSYCGYGSQTVYVPPPAVALAPPPPPLLVLPPDEQAARPPATAITAALTVAIAPARRRALDLDFIIFASLGLKFLGLNLEWRQSDLVDVRRGA